jgi:hypothetical protein
MGQYIIYWFWEGLWQSEKYRTLFSLDSVYLWN